MSDNLKRYWVEVHVVDMGTADDLNEYGNPVTESIDFLADFDTIDEADEHADAMLAANELMGGNND